MKHIKGIVLAAALLAMAGVPGVSWAGNGAGITGSPHDFSAAAWNTVGDICSVCHVPHDNGRPTTMFADGLLWNHALSAATYRMYAEEAALSTTFANHIDAPSFDNEPTGGSKLCLGCHDGTVSVDQFGSNPGGTQFVLPASEVPSSAYPLIGGEKNLLGTHPISIVYDPVADTGLAPTTNLMGASGTTIADVLEPTAAGPKLQCASCHDVHDGAGEAIAGTKLLRESMSAPASGLCLTCHLK